MCTLAVRALCSLHSAHTAMATVHWVATYFLPHNFEHIKFMLILKIMEYLVPFANNEVFKLDEWMDWPNLFGQNIHPRQLPKRGKRIAGIYCSICCRKFARNFVQKLPLEGRKLETVLIACKLVSSWKSSSSFSLNRIGLSLSLFFLLLSLFNRITFARLTITESNERLQLIHQYNNQTRAHWR